MNVYDKVYVESDKVPIGQKFIYAEVLKQVEGKLEPTEVKLLVFKDVVMMPQKEFNELIFHLENKQEQ